MESLPKKICAKLIVCFVWLLIIFLGTTFSILYLPSLFLKDKIYFIVLTCIFAGVFILLVISYAKVTCTDAGSPNDELTELYRKYNRLEELKSLTSQRQGKRKIRRKNQYRNGSLDKQELLQEIQEMKTDEYCSKCCIARPSRAHHCSVCNKCILRMDHHCPWTGNCIGQRNHKYFLLFLLYATLGLALVSFNMLIDWVFLKKVAGDIRQEWKVYAFPAIGIISFILMLSIGFLLISQVLMISDNLTTLQSFVEGIEEHNPFDKGTTGENLKQIFGTQGLSLLPTAPIFDKASYVNENQLNV